MHTLQLVLLSLAALLAILFGIRYFAARQFMPYHEAVAGKPWAELDPGVRTIILGMLKIVGGGLVTYGIAVLWLLVPLSARQTWAAWAVLALTLSGVLPSLYVTILLRKAAPAARTPIGPAAAALVIAVVGAGLSFID